MIEDKKLPGGGGQEGQEGGNAKEIRKLLGIKAVFIIIVMMVSQMYTYVQACQIAHFQYVQCIVYQLYLAKLLKAQLK